MAGAGQDGNVRIGKAGMPRRPRVGGTARLVAVLLGVFLAVLLCGSCTAGHPDPGPAPGPAALWADRPVVSLAFDTAADLRSADGQERVVFTPDLATCELVFRAWPNKPMTSRAGSSLVVDRVTVDGKKTAVQDVPAGAPNAAPAGTLLRVPLTSCLQPGQSVTAVLDFALTFGKDPDERVGTSSAEPIAWFGTAFPLLAWERGQGWDRDPAVPVNGEMAVSEDFRLDSLEVTAPAEYQVWGTGTASGTRPGAHPGTTVHEFTATAVRDVAVTVGRLDGTERTVDGVRLHLAAAQGTRTDLSAWADEIATSQRALTALLGPFPYADLWVTIVPSQSSGIEFPGAIQFGDVDPEARGPLLAHELAHMWFYGLVGNDQGRDPWLDESFATFAQLVTAGGSSPAYADIPAAERRDVGQPMTFWTRFRDPSLTYYDTVYNVGAAALVQARHEVGADAFDAALRGYLHRKAYSIATPQDVAAAFAGLPPVLVLLRQVGALPSAGG
jgi:peptidase M1-like protein